MKTKFLLGLMLIFSLSLIFAHGGDIENQSNGYYTNIPTVSIDLKIMEINDQVPIVLAVDEKGIYYILRLENMFMFYNNLPIEAGKEVNVKATILYSFSKLEELLVTSIEIDNKEYIIPKNFGYRYPGMMCGNMMYGYGYPGNINNYGYPDTPGNTQEPEMHNNMMGNN
ncbi:hypothetical protein [Marinitoga litoralis]|uniref:hypothetical protein n=1 Tax=Marinitoga litoralis TaxID=570855 RepID=UPI001961CFAE|nr:hypothetical protein [Marinitoga litoralis]MBM7559761.1 hypothetical protein [Marinitoga litoralis]